MLSHSHGRESWKRLPYLQLNTVFPLAMAIILAMAILHGKNWIDAGSRKQKRPENFGLPTGIGRALLRARFFFCGDGVETGIRQQYDLKRNMKKSEKKF